MQDFIGIFDEAIDSRMCGELISYFDDMQRLGLAYPRQDRPAHVVDDLSVFPMAHLKLGSTEPLIVAFMPILWDRWRQYTEIYSILTAVPPYGVLRAKLQKTEPGGGYHGWHSENLTPLEGDRIAVFQVNLNTVDQGGETEFLYLKRRVSPLRGRLMIWPAGYTHTHRGNPPYSGNKYILTGWIEWLR